MKKRIQLLCCPVLFLSLYACRRAEDTGAARSRAISGPGIAAWNQPFIPVDSADTMIKSYLTSINYQSNDSSVRSFIIDASALRRYLTQGKGAGITSLKIMLAHTRDYIRAGHYGRPCGYGNVGLTVVLAGYGSNGNYIYTPDNKVLDYSMPCPENCPKAGSAADDLLSN